MRPPPKNSHGPLHPKIAPPDVTKSAIAIIILQLLQYMKNPMNNIPSRPPFYLEAWIWAKHYNSESPILNFWRSFQGNSRKLKHQHFGEIPSPPVGLDRYDLSRGFIPSPSDQSDHPPKTLTSGDFNSPSLQQIQKNPLRFLVVFFWIFPAGTLRTSFWAVFPACPDECHPLLQCYLDFFFIKLKKQVKLSFAKTIPWVGRWSFPFLGGKLGRILHSIFWGGFFINASKILNWKLASRIPTGHKVAT